MKINLPGTTDPAQDFHAGIKEAIRLQRYRRDPVAYCRDVLGVDLWSGKELVKKYNLTEEILREKYQHTIDGTADSPVLEVSGQREIIAACATSSKIGVASGFNMGKTFVASCIVPYWLRTRIPSLVLTIAPTNRQVKNQLRGEIRKRFALAAFAGNPLGGEMYPKACQWDIDFDQRWYAIGFSTDDVENLQGFHHEHLLVICDEAFAIPLEFMKRIEDFEPELWVNIGNPTDMGSYLGEVFRDPEVAIGWEKFVLSQELSPNVLAKKRVVAGICSPTRPADALRRVGGNRDDPFYRFGQRGQFPISTENTLISWWDLVAALNRGKEQVHIGEPRYGLDVAYGNTGAYNVFYARYPESNTAECLIRRQTDNHPVLLNDMCDIIKKLGYIGVCFDLYGVGASINTLVYERMDDPETTSAMIAILESFRGIRWGNRTKDGERIEEKRRYFNRRSELYHMAVDWIRNGGAINDIELAKELSKVRTVAKSDRTIAIEPKENFQGREGYSPDRADAFVLTFEDPFIIPMVGDAKNYG